MASQRTRNRRRTERFPAEIVVRVYRRNSAVAEYRTRDVSQGGVGLFPGRVMFWPGSRVEVQLYSPVRGRAVARRIPAVVRYCSSRGMGLKFRAPELPLMPRLQRADG